ncbi:MAG TPA: hypothetical protein VME42_04490 [Steroidobacteraceae bacterium]|nr:hypothetical protein [Steroidobacteraceae bacterium]
MRVGSARFLLLAVSSVALVALAGGGRYVIRKEFVLGGEGGWDYLAVDSRAHRLFISRADRVLIVDTRRGSLIGTIPDTQGVHGFALVPQLGKGFTSNGRANTVTVFDLQSLKPTGTIDVRGQNPDAILYDAASKRLFTFNGRSRDISVIDPLEGVVLATLPAGGKPEFAAADGAGRVYFNIEDTSQIGVIDTATEQRIAAWPLPDCEAPTGLALDVAHRRLFSTCGNGVLAVTDAGSGKHVAAVPIGKGPDAAVFDRERGLIFSSNGLDGTLTVIHEDDPDHYTVVDTAATQRSARTMALDAGTHEIYLVAAQFAAATAPAAEQPHRRPAVLAGTFKVLVIGN